MARNLQAFSVRASPGFATADARWRRDHLSAVPGTDAFRIRRRALLRSRVRDWLALLAAVEALPDEARSLVTARLRRHWVRSEELRLRGRFLAQAVLVGGLTLLAFAVMVMLQGIDWVPATSGLLRFIIGWLTWLCAVALVTVPWWVGQRSSAVLWKSHRLAPIWLGLGLLLPVIVLALRMPRPEQAGLGADAAFGLVAGAAAAAVWVVGVVLTMIPVVLAEELYRSVERRSHPDGLVVEHLFIALSLAAMGPWRRGGADSRELQTRHLELAALRLERDLPRSLATEDATNDAAVRAVLQGAAASIRELKLWVRLPYDDTHEHLTKRLSDAVVITSAGQWQRLPRAPIPEADPRLRLRIIRSLGRVAAALLPLGLLLIVQATDLRVEGEIASYLTLLAVLWLVLGLLALLDPRFDGKLAALKDVAAMGPFHRGAP